MIANEMRVAAGQLWELPSEGMADPIQLRVMEVADDGYAAVQTVRRSAPDVALHRSTMHVREVMDTGVLVDGPGALDPPCQARAGTAPERSSRLRGQAVRVAYIEGRVPV